MTDDDEGPRPQSDTANATDREHVHHVRHKPGPVPGSDAARRGGRAARDRLGIEHYRRIGKVGGATASARHGLEFYTAIGKKGGATTKERHGLEHFRQMGRLGGKAKARQHDQETQDPATD